MTRAFVLLGFALFDIALLIVAFHDPALAQQSSSYKLEEQVFNSGGDPLHGVFLGSASFDLRLGALGGTVAVLDSSSASHHVSGGLVPVVLGFDTDADGWRDSQDCDAVNGLVHQAPAPVEGLSVQDIPGGIRLTWTSQAVAAGAGTLYDNFSGDVLAMLASLGDFSSGSCLDDNVTVSSYDFLGPMPGSGQAIYFMLRGQNSCGTGTYGTPNRDSTAGSSAVPCD